ncbi:LINE-1 retrotransposable element ORF2 protein [Linum perenne]
MDRLHFLCERPEIIRGDTEEDDIRTEIVQCWKRDEIYWAQRACVNWLKLGDKNTKFFHQSTIQRRKLNTIGCMKTEADRWVEEPEAVKAYIRSYYHDLFTAPREVQDYSMLAQFPQVVTSSMNEVITRAVTDTEIKAAVFQMGPLKAPGPDGFPGKFFQKHWTLVGHDVCSEVRAFFDTAVLPTEWSDTNITLIPKIQNPDMLSQFHPISVANFRSKIISKILATRIKPFIPSLISELQAAFTGNRTIQDNVVVVHEAVHRLNLRKKGNDFSFLLKVDMLKAFDRVSWDFLFATLTVMGFSDIFVHWIREILTSVRFNVLVNGGQSGFFHPTRGLRQGDPLSPFLFIVVSNVLSFLMTTAVEEGGIKGMRLTPRCPVLHHILFADDTVLCGKATVTEAQRMKSILDMYCCLSGQAVNETKSAIHFSANTPSGIKNEVTRVFGVNSNINLGKYLGLPLEWGRSKVEALHFLVERMQNKSHSWKSLLLSQAGRETMIKAVLQAVPAFIFSCFQLPRTTLKQMDGIVGRFWWAGDGEKKSIHWVAKHDVQRPKCQGGMGFRNFEDFNLAFLAKMGWKILTQPESLWVRLLKALYFPNSDFMMAKKGSKTSWLWNSILAGREALLKGCRRNIGNGHDTWLDDPWIPDTDDFRCHPSVMVRCKVSDFILQPQREWDIPKLRSIFSEDIVKQIVLIQLSPPNYSDKWVWHQNSKGLFSVKSCYNVLTNERSLHPQRFLQSRNKEWRWLWRLSLPLKVVIFLWKLCQNGLATKENLFKRKCAADGICPCCNTDIECWQHLLFFCSVPQAFWMKNFPSVRLPVQGEDFLLWLSDICTLHPNYMQALAFALWNLWKIRNAAVFRSEAPTLEGVERKIAYDVRMWSMASEPVVSSEVSSGADYLPVIQPPVFFRRKLTCDGSFVDDIQKAGYAVIVFNDEGQVVDGRADTFFCRAAIVAKRKPSLLQWKCQEMNPALSFLIVNYLLTQSILHSKCGLGNVQVSLLRYVSYSIVYPMLGSFGRIEYMLGLRTWLQGW